jgi:hypothetical protein
MQGHVAAWGAVFAAVVAIDADMKRMSRASEACRRLMTIPGIGRLTALASTAAIDDPERFRRSRDLGAYLGLPPRRYQSGEVDYTGSISRGFYMALPPMLQGKLPGSGALLIEHDGDEGGLVFWTKGVLACRPAPVPKALITALKQTKTGKLDIYGDEL